ncbi:MAG: hypothetical protein HC906_01880 [Bacteroidales bacterium]|nr:hypothetical protein [Bacteroidales bacterium]
MLYHNIKKFYIPFYVDGRIGSTDFELNGLFPGRFDQDGIWSHQYMPVEGAIALPYFISANKYLLAAGGDFKLLSKSLLNLIRIYGNVVQYQSNLNEGLLYEAGIKVGQPGLLEVFFPILYDKNDFSELEYKDLIRFNLNLKVANPFSLMERIRNL